MPGLRRAPNHEEPVSLRIRRLASRVAAWLTRTLWQGRGRRIGVVVGSLTLIGGMIGATLLVGTLVAPATRHSQRTAALPPGVPTWVTSTSTTTPRGAGTEWTRRDEKVAPEFSAYYGAHAGKPRLGSALTPAFPTASGLVQIFTNGALLQPLSPANALSSPVASGPLAVAVAAAGTRDDPSSVVAIPLTQALLAFGSQAPIPGAGGSLTYAQMRAAARPASLTTSAAGCASGGTFVATSHATSGDRGYCIPAATWAWLQNQTALPDGWQTDIGQPLTQALPATAQQDGTTSHVLVQAFWNAVLVTDLDTPNSTTAATTATAAVSIAPTGLAYLATFGPPSVEAGPLRPAWIAESNRDDAVEDAPGGKTLLTLGRNYPVTLTDARWVGAQLWYAVRYATGGGAASGWLPADALTFAAPPSGIAGAPWAGMGVLSPQLGTYLQARGNQIGVTVYDVTHNTFYTYNGNRTFFTGSSVKVPIILTYLDTEEHEGAEPNTSDVALLTQMIEQSDNNAAQVFYDRLGDGPPIAAYLNRLGVTSYTPNPQGFGWSTFTSTGMVRLLIQLEQGTILTAHDRAFTLNLMEHVVSYQQMGIGQTAPKGATYAMKDGWVTGPDGLWNANTSGIVWTKNDTYIISVYVGEQYSLGTAYGMLNTVCGQVAQTLTSQP